MRTLDAALSDELKDFPPPTGKPHFSVAGGNCGWF
jgi:hypothetical protein